MAGPTPYYPDGWPIPAEKLAEAEASGQVRWQGGTMVPIEIGGEGGAKPHTTMVPAERVTEMKRKGWRVRDLGTFEEEQRFLEAGRDPAEIAKASAEALARVPTAGFSDVALGAALGAEYSADAKRRKEANPLLTTGIEVGGTVAAAVLSGGGSVALKGGVAAGKGQIKKQLARGIAGEADDAARAVTRAARSSIDDVAEVAAAKPGSLLRELSDATLPGQIAKRASQIGHGVEQAIAGQAPGRARQAIARAAGAGTEGALEGSALQIGQNASALALDDEDFTTEKLLAGTVDMGLTGGMAGVMLGGGLGLLARPARALDDTPGLAQVSSSSQVVPELSPIRRIQQKLSDTFAGPSAKLSGKNADDIRVATSATDEGQRVRRHFFRRQEMTDTATADISERATRLHRNSPVTRAIAKGEIKTTNVQQTVARGQQTVDQAGGYIDELAARLDADATQKVSQTQLNQANRALAKARKAGNQADVAARQADVDALMAQQARHAELDDSFGTGAKLVRKRAAEHAKRLRAAQSTGDEAEMFLAIENVKRDMDQLSIKFRGSRPGDAAGIDAKDAGLAYSTEIADRARRFLEDESIWGQAGRNQREVNAAITKALKNKEFERAFIRRTSEKVGGDADEFEFWSDTVEMADPAKVRGYLEGLDNADRVNQHRLINEGLQARVEMLETMQRTGVVPESQAARIEEMIGDARALRNSLDEHTQVAQDISLVKRLQQEELAGAATGMIGQGAATITGTVLGGAPGAMVGAAVDAMGRVANTLRSPYSVVQRIAALEAVTGKAAQTELRVAKAMRRVVRGQPATKSAFDVGSAVTSGVTSATVLSANRKDRQKKYDKIRKNVEGYMARREVLPEYVARHVVSGLGEAAPGVVSRAIEQHQRVLENLNRRMPAPDSGGSTLQPHLSARFPPSDAEMREFLMYASGALNPLSVIEDPAAGAIAPEAVEGLRDNWPRLYQHMRTTAIETLAKTHEAIPFNRTVQLSLLFELDGDDSLLPETLQRQANRYGAKREREQAKPQPPSRQKIPDLSEFSQTQSERLANSI